MKKLEKKEIIGLAALLIHAAKIDEIYTESEKKIIQNFIGTFIENKDNINSYLNEAEKFESDSNQLLNYLHYLH